MKANLKSARNTILFLIIGIFFFWLAYRKTDFDKIMQILEDGVNYHWIFFSLCLGLLSHVFRALRWSLLLEPVEGKPSFWNSFFAVFMGYFANLALPRMGELTRCGVLMRYENFNFTRTLGTVVTERIVDILSMIIFCALTVVLQLSVFESFFSTNAISWKSNPLLISGIVLGIVLVVIAICVIFKRHKNNVWVLKVKDIGRGLVQGMQSIKLVRRKGVFIFYSIAIWILYYLMNYTCMFAFDFLSGITASQALFVFIAGTFSMLLPVQGGIGPWHTFTINALALYGIGNTQAGAFALLAHGAPMLMIILCGFICMILLPIYNRKRKV